jgi:uncharacterized damage-inducible protein DinB
MEARILVQEVLNLLGKEQAHISLENALEGLKPENRAKKPKENLHSVWDELEHIRIAQEDILKYMIDPDWKSPAWPDEYWPPVTDKISDAEWNKSLNQFISDRDKMISIIEKKGEELTTVIPHTESHTYLREALIAAQHNSYHIAQIALIRKMLGDWK